MSSGELPRSPQKSRSAGSIYDPRGQVCTTITRSTPRGSFTAATLGGVVAVELRYRRSQQVSLRESVGVNVESEGKSS
jgi:hypothetical protein